MKRLLPVLVLPLILASCSKVSKANYEKLKVGMTYAEVERILGKPGKCDEAMIAQVCTWGSEKRNITVSFIGKQAILYTGKGLK